MPGERRPLAKSGGKSSGIMSCSIRAGAQDAVIFLKPDKMSHFSGDEIKRL
jgi:hypothetical protein